MIGVVSTGRFPVEVLNDLRQVSESGKIPGRRRRGHRDGWGVASFVDGSPVYLGRSPKWAAEDALFETAIDRASELPPPCMLIGHVRAASRGKATLANAHPFIVGGLVLGHNGTITEFNPRTRRKPMGETDSERLALIVADRYKEEGELSETLRSVIREEVLEREFTGAVIIASDGEKLCGYRDYSENGDYYDLRIASSKESVVLFQETGMEVGGSISRIKRRELVSVGLDLKVERERIH